MLTQGDTVHTQHHSPCPPASARWPGRSPRSPYGACISGSLLWKTSPLGRGHSHSPHLWCHSHRTGRGTGQRSTGEHASCTCRTCCPWGHRHTRHAGCIVHTGHTGCFQKLLLLGIGFLTCPNCKPPLPPTLLLSPVLLGFGRCPSPQGP